MKKHLKTAEFNERNRNRRVTSYNKLHIIIWRIGNESDQIHLTTFSLLWTFWLVRAGDEMTLVTIIFNPSHVYKYLGSFCYYMYRTDVMKVTSSLINAIILLLCLWTQICNWWLAPSYHHYQQYARTLLFS